MNTLELANFDSPRPSNSGGPERSFEACTHPGNVDPEQQPKLEPIPITIQTDEFTLEEEDPNDSCFLHCPVVHQKLRQIVNIDNADEIRNLVEWVNTLRADCVGPSQQSADQPTWHCSSELAAMYED